jgi:transposase-like protein
MSTDKDGPEMYPTEVPEKAQRRRFDAEYRLRIVEEADKCTKFGEVGELLRREGLYRSQLANWRQQRDDGTLSQAGGKKRGRKPKGKDPSAAELIRLRRDRDRLAERLRQAELIIEVQKKVFGLLDASTRGSKKVPPTDWCGALVVWVAWGL